MATVVNNSGGSPGRPAWQWILSILLLVIVVYLLYSYFILGRTAPQGTVQPSQSPPIITTLPTLTPGGATVSATPSPGVTTQILGPTSAPLQIAVNATEFAFSPPSFSAKAGQPVRITFTNNGQFPHDLSLPDLKVGTNVINPGQSATISFTPDKAGTYNYICTVPGHAERGMKGTFTVQ